MMNVEAIAVYWENLAKTWRKESDFLMLNLAERVVKTRT
jgi:hypothetical protein